MRPNSCVIAFLALMQEVDCDSDQSLGDKGYDSDAVRQEIADHAAKPLFELNRTEKYNKLSTRPSTGCVTASSGSSTA
jgi:hypothetical protein